MKTDAADFFIEASRMNPSLTNLNLDYNDINVRSLKELGSVLKRNNTRQHKELVPKLRKQIEYLTFDSQRVDALQLKLERIKREKSHISLKLCKNKSLFEDIKNQEEAKTKNILEQRDFGKKAFQKACVELGEVEEKISLLHLNKSKEVNQWMNMISLLSFNIKKLEKGERNLKEKFKLKDSDNEFQLKKLKEDCYSESLAQNRATRNYEEALAKLEELKALKDQRNTDRKDLYLATEKLAEVKREQLRTREGNLSRRSNGVL